MVLAQVTAQQLADTCTPTGGGAGNTFCETVYRITGVEVLGRIAGVMFPVVFEIALILIVAVVANRLARRAIKRFERRIAEGGIGRLGGLGRGAPDQAAPNEAGRAASRTQTIGSVLRSITTGTIAVLAGTLILGALGINLGPLIAGAGIVGIALGFGAQNLVRDFLAGIFILLEDQYGLGDVVDVGDAGNVLASGTVEGFTLRVTRLRDVQGTVWWVPNGEIRRVGNSSQLWARSLIDVRVAYGTEVEHATRVIKGVADAVWQDERWASQILEEPEVWGVEGFGVSEYLMRLVVKVEPARQWAVNRELRARLLAAFEQEGIEVPQQTVWMREHGGVTPPKHRSASVPDLPPDSSAT